MGLANSISKKYDPTATTVVEVATATPLSLESQNQTMPPLNMGLVDKHKLLHQKTFIVDPLKTADYTGLNRYDKFKYFMFHNSDIFLAIIIIILIIILIWTHYDDPDLSDIILNNALIILTVYYSALIALKGYTLSIKIHKAVEDETYRLTTARKVEIEREEQEERVRQNNNL